jgi:hypothetical protein
VRSTRPSMCTLDQRGHGDSGRPDGDYSAEEYADDLHLFFHQVGIDKAIDVDGDYALQMENPAGLAQALAGFAAQAVRD